MQHLEQREVKLHQLRGEFFSLGCVVERELVQQDGGVVLRLEPDAPSETKRFHLARHHALHRGVILGHELEQEVRGVARRASLRIAQLVHQHVEQLAFPLGTRAEKLVRRLDGFLLEHGERVAAQRVERVDEPRVGALDEILDVPVQQALALVGALGGRREGLLGEVTKLAIGREESVAKEFLQRGDRLHRASLATLDARLLEQREETLEALEVRHGVLLRQHGGGGDLIRRGTLSSHELEPLRLGRSRARSHALVVGGALLQRLGRDRLLGVHVRLGELFRRLGHLGGERERLRSLEPDVGQALAVAAAVTRAAARLLRRARARAGVPLAPAPRGKVAGTEVLLRLIVRPLLLALAPGAAEHAAADHGDGQTESNRARSARSSEAGGVRFAGARVRVASDECAS